MQWAAIPRREHTNLSYSQFLREFALPGIPVILQGDPGHGWPAKYHWNTLSGLKSRGLDMNEEVQVQLGGDGVATMPLSDCLESFEARKRTKALNRNPMSPLRSVDGVKRQRCTGGHSIAAGSSCASPAVHSAIAGSAGPAYLRNWRFHERNPHLLQDFTIPPLFELDFAVEAGLIQRHSFTWLYIGEDGSSTPTHVDVMNTGAWLYLTAGQKRWRMVSGTLLPHCYPSLPAASPAEGGDSLGGSMVDLFDDEAASSALRDVARNEPGCYEGVLRPGEIIFTPSKCAHAVVNDGLTIAVTSNFVDLGNLVDVYDSLSGNHPNGNPLPFFPDSTPEQLLAICVPRALSLLEKRWPHDAAKICRLLKSMLHAAVERRAALLAARFQILDSLSQSLRG